MNFKDMVFLRIANLRHGSAAEIRNQSDAPFPLPVRDDPVQDRLPHHCSGVNRDDRIGGRAVPRVGAAAGAGAEAKNAARA